jgi:glycerophosphoryl diester phosphodiesterase
MSTYSRRTFLKRSAMLTAMAAASRLYFPSAAASPQSLSRQGDGHAFFAQAKSLDVIAHRGGDNEWPGETMYAYRHAVGIGVDVLEMDVYRSKDGELVLMHNMTVNETTNGTGLVNRLRREELQQLNAGFNWDKGDDKDKFYRKELNKVPEDIRNDLRVATLEEVFKAFPQLRMNIEMKLSLLSPVEKLCDMIKKFHMEDKVLVASFWHFYLKKFRSLCPNVATSASVAELINYKLFNIRPNANAIQLTPEVEFEIARRTHKIKLPMLTREFVRKAHDDGLKVHAWTINDPDEIKRIRDLCVDGIITDSPTHLLSVREQSPPAPCGQS